MIDESIKIVLEERGDLDFKPLYTLMEESGLEFKNQRLRQVLGVATYSGIFLDMEKFRNYTDDSKFFVILHEIAHGKRIKKFGKKWVIGRLSLEDFDEFVAGIIHEEILADRYASYVLFKLTGYSFPRQMTQQLHFPEKQEDYKRLIRPLFGMVKYSEEKYDQLFKQYLIL